MCLLLAALALARFSGPPDEWDGLRCRIASAGDVDRDGTPDLLVADLEAEIGIVWVLNGRDGCPLFSVVGEAPGDGFGRSLSGRSGEVLGSAEGDWFESPLCLWRNLDGDRRTELFVTHRSGRVEARRGPGLERVKDLAPTSGFCEGRPLWALAVGGDADGDGVADLLVSFIHCGVAVVSGVTLEPLHLIAPYEMGSRADMSAAGSSVDWIGDVDRDGRDDFVVAASESERIHSPSPGFAHIYSGRTAELLRSYKPARKRMDACRAGDADRDGIPDVAVFVEEDDLVRVLAGDNLRTLWELRLDDLRR